MMNILKSDECLENLAGISADVYVGIKSALSAPLTAEENVYSTPAFASGKGLYKIQGKNEAQKISFSSLGPRKGYDLGITIVIESLNKTFSKAGRALNNLDLFFIVKDGDESLIMYDPNRRCEADNGGIAGDTGDTADSDRQATCEFHLKPVKYPLLYVTEPQTGGWDGLMGE
jgi:hypothetical protein